MKKDTGRLPDESLQSQPELPERAATPKPRKTEHDTRDHQHQIQPLGQILNIRPDVDVPTLLAYACETLAAVNAMAQEFSRELDGPQRLKLVAIQQLTMLAELMVSRAWETVDPMRLAIRPASPVCH